MTTASSTSATTTNVSAFHVMSKPIGPICNLDCHYCFYLEKEKLYKPGESWKMSDAVLDIYVRDYIQSQDTPELNFAWQGGEPTLLGVDFFQKVVDLQSRYANGKKIHNALQTNGTLLDDRWCAFLKQHEFLVGISIDGPRDLHDAYRVDKKQQPTFDRVFRGIKLLHTHKVEFNTLTVVNRKNSQRPLDVYRFLKSIGSGYIQFIPLVERAAPPQSLAPPMLDLATPPVPGEAIPDLPVTPWSVEAHQYGQFLVEIFDDWVRHDVGKIFVQTFDVALANWLGAGSGLCVFAEKCGTAMAIEHNGDVYSCDHYVYPDYKLGNILNQSLGAMVNSDFQKKFGSDKLDTLPDYCRRCEVRFACNGECPKHRFIRTPDGEPGLNYLCPAYKRFFKHVDPYMKQMAALLRQHRPAAEIMRIQAKQIRSGEPPDRNDPCPCGSGKKFKKCCGSSL